MQHILAIRKEQAIWQHLMQPCKHVLVFRTDYKSLCVFIGIKLANQIWVCQIRKYTEHPSSNFYHACLCFAIGHAKTTRHFGCFLFCQQVSKQIVCFFFFSLFFFFFSPSLSLSPILLFSLSLFPFFVDFPTTFFFFFFFLFIYLFLFFFLSSFFFLSLVFSVPWSCLSQCG